MFRHIPPRNKKGQLTPALRPVGELEENPDLKADKYNVGVQACLSQIIVFTSSTIPSTAHANFGI